MQLITTQQQHIAIAKVKPNWDFWGLIDINGNYVIEPLFNAIYGWNDGIAAHPSVCAWMQTVLSVSLTIHAKNYWQFKI